MTGESRFVRWWRENPEKAEAIKERRRQKLEQNPALRDAERKRHRRRRKRSKRAKRVLRPRVIYHDGQPVEVWAAGMVSDYLDCPKRTITWMENHDRIPINRWQDSLKRRWWPADFVRWLKSFFVARQRREISAREFAQRVFEGWSTERQKGIIPDLMQGETHEQRSESGDHREVEW